MKSVVAERDGVGHAQEIVLDEYCRLIEVLRQTEHC
jgi:hypothetical protein